MKLIPITVEELRANDARNYNPRTWEQNIDSLVNRMKDVQFYIEPKESSGYSYDKFYAIYTIPEGIRLLNDFGYSSCIHNGGFAQVLIMEDGTVVKREFSNGKTTGRLENCKQNRLYMAKESQEKGIIFTND